jgi:2C-methyl-D-erythritol 2,4-cyclodiphosphate synthase
VVDIKIYSHQLNYILEEPRLNQYLDEIKRNLSKYLFIPENAISIKPKRKEGMDATGRKEAVEVFTICLIEEVK